jgi:hypothetical protein
MQNHHPKIAQRSDRETAQRLHDNHAARPLRATAS